MPKDSPGERIATLEADVRNILLTNQSIKDYMERADGRGLQNAVDISHIKECVNDFKAYQVGCDAERLTQNRRITALEESKRIAALEEDNRFIKRTTKWVSALIVFVVSAVEAYRVIK